MSSSREIHHDPRPAHPIDRPELVSQFIYPMSWDWLRSDARGLNQEFFRGDLFAVWESACLITDLSDVERPDWRKLDSVTLPQFTVHEKNTSDIFSMNGSPDPIVKYLEITERGGPDSWEELVAYVGAMQEALQIGFGIWRWHYAEPNGYGTIGSDLKLHVTSFAENVSSSDAERYMGNRGYKTGHTRTSRILQWCDAYQEQEPTAAYTIRALLTAKPEVLACYMYNPRESSEEPILLPQREASVGATALISAYPTPYESSRLIELSKPAPQD